MRIKKVLKRANKSTAKVWERLKKTWNELNAACSDDVKADQMRIPMQAIEEAMNSLEKLGDFMDKRGISS